MGWNALALALLILAPAFGLAEASGAQGSIPPFLLAVSVSAPGGARSGATLGVDPNGTDAYDRGLNLPAPPAPPGGAWAAAYFGDDRLARDLRGPGPQATWSLRVDADGPAGMVCLAWNASQLAAFPLTWTLNATHANQTVDLREAPNLSTQKASGPASLFVVVHVEPMWGSTPAAPAAVSAAPGPGLGDATLTWAAPADDGGHPVRGYVVYRSDNGGTWSVVARTTAPTYVDHDLALGTIHAYEVSARNLLGEGNRSGEAPALGTGKPAPLQPQSPGPGEHDTPLVAAQDSLPQATLTLPPMNLPLLAVQGGPTTEDGGIYELAITAAGQSQSVSVFTLYEVPVPLNVTLATLPGASAASPQGNASVELDGRQGAGDGLPESFTLRTSARVGPAAWDDATALP